MKNKQQFIDNLNNGVITDAMCVATLLSYQKEIDEIKEDIAKLIKIIESEDCCQSQYESDKLYLYHLINMKSRLYDKKEEILNHFTPDFVYIDVKKRENKKYNSVKNINRRFVVEKGVRGSIRFYYGYKIKNFIFNRPIEVENVKEELKDSKLPIFIFDEVEKEEINNKIHQDVENKFFTNIKNYKLDIKKEDITYVDAKLNIKFTEIKKPENKKFKLSMIKEQIKERIKE